MSQLKWFAAYTRPNRERKVAELFVKKGIESYCPQNRIYVQLNGRKKVITEPLFTSTVFIYLQETEKSTVLKTRGVINLLYWHSQPAVIKSEEIDAIKQFLVEYPHVELEKTSVKPSHDVHIINGPLLKRKGNLLEVLNSTVKVVLPSLGQVLVAETRKENAASIVYREQFRVRV